MSIEIGWLFPNTKRERDPGSMLNGKHYTQSVLIPLLSLPRAYSSGIPNEVLGNWNPGSPVSPLFCQFFNIGSSLVVSVCFVGPSDDLGRLTHGGLLIRFGPNNPRVIPWEKIRSSLKSLPLEMHVCAGDAIRRLEGSSRDDVYVNRFLDMWDAACSDLQYKSGSSELLERLPVEYRTEYPYKKKISKALGDEVSGSRGLLIVVGLIVIAVTMGVGLCSDNSDLPQQESEAAP